MLSIQNKIYSCARGHAQKNIDISAFKSIEIPLPPLEMQREIVAEVEGYQKVIDGARMVLAHYRPHITVDPAWPLVALGEVAKMGGSITTVKNSELPFFGPDSFEQGTGKLLKIESASNQRVTGTVYEYDGKRLLYCKIRPYLNKLAIVNFPGYCGSDIYPLIVDEPRANIVYLSMYLLSDDFQEMIKQFFKGARIPRVNQSDLFSVKIPLPPIEAQRAIVAEIEAEQALVDANRELVARMEGKIQAAMARVWGEGLGFMIGGNHE